MFNIDQIAKLISENIDDIYYDGPEDETEEFEEPNYWRHFDDDYFGDEGETPEFDDEDIPFRHDQNTSLTRIDDTYQQDRGT